MATLDKVVIGNLALSNIGTRSTIEDFDEDSVEARHVKLWYDIIRIQSLEGYDWNFARKRLTLSSHADDPPEDQWAYRYQYPSDCVKFRFIEQVTTDADAIPFEIETDDAGDAKSILTDLDDAVGVYTRDIEAVNLFPMWFSQTIAMGIAWMIAPALAGKEKKAEKLRDQYLGMMATAGDHDANERVQKPPRDTDWVRARA